MKPAVVILNWNGSALLRRFLPDVVANTHDARIIVADNGSDDDSLQLLSDSFPSVEVLRLDRNYGYAEGYNRALRLIDNELVVLLNSDVAPLPGWLAPLVSRMEEHPEVAACQPKILSADHPERFEYAGAAGGFLDRHGYPYCRGRIFSTVEEDHGQYDTVCEVDWASGAALMVRRSLYFEAGGLDPLFFAHMEEIDLCWRLRLMGYKCECVPQSAVRHLGGGSLAASDPRKTYLNFRNNLLMMHRCLAPGRLRRRALIVRRLLDTLAWAKEVATLRWRHAAAILRAHRHYRRLAPSLTPPPSSSSSSTSSTTPSISNTSLTPPPSLSSPRPSTLKGRPDILTAYYLRRRKRFTDLP